MNALRYLPFAARGLRRKGPPLHLTLFVTGRCNLRCRHCFHWREVAASAAGPSPEQVRALADSAARMGPLLWLSFGGGEPFLRSDLPELARAFGRHGLRHLAIPTNGLLERTREQAERILAENPALFLSVAVSFDGPPEVHDAIRQVPGGHARACAAVRTLLAIERHRDRLGVGLLLTMTSENQDVLARHMEELADDLRPDNVTINLARGDALDPRLLEVDPARYRELASVRRGLLDSGRIPYFRFPLARLAAARDELTHERVAEVASGRTGRHLPCTAATLSAVIFESGEVHPCEILGRPLGNLNDVAWDLERLWRPAPAERLRADIRSTRCACTWECAQADNVLFAPRAWPRLAARALALKLR